jgi:hypothetical protein
MIRSSILLIFLFISFYTSAQINISGKIVDFVNKPISYTYINVYDNKELYYIQTDSLGRFSYNSNKNSNLIKIEINHLSYRKNVQLLHKSLSDLIITLYPDTTLSLPTVIVSKKTFEEKGDTLIYNLSDFANNKDLYVGDVIDRIPGLSKTENGRLIYNGKIINNYLIENENLLNSNYNLANDIIRYKLIDQIEIIKNYKYQKANSENTSDEVAINLKLKSTSKNVLAGQAAVATNSIIPFENLATSSIFITNKVQNLNTIEFDNYYKSKYSIFEHFVLKDNDFENYFINSISKSNPYFNINNNQFLIDDWRYSTTRNHKLSTNILKRVDSTKIYKLNVELKNIVNSFDFYKNNEFYYTSDTLKLTRNENNYININTVNVKFTKEKNTSKEFLSTISGIEYYKKIQSVVDNTDFRYFSNQKQDLNNFRLYYDIDYLNKIYTNTVIVFKSTSNYITNLEKDNLDNTNSNFNTLQNLCGNYLNNFSIFYLKKNFKKSQYEIYLSGIGNYFNYNNLIKNNTSKSNYSLDANFGLKYKYANKSTIFNLDIPINYKNLNSNIDTIFKKIYFDNYNISIENKFKNLKFKVYFKNLNLPYNISELNPDTLNINYFTRMSNRDVLPIKSLGSNNISLIYERAIKGLYYNIVFGNSFLHSNQIPFYTKFNNNIILSYKFLNNTTKTDYIKYEFGKYFFNLKASFKFNYTNQFTYVQIYDYNGLRNNTFKSNILGFEFNSKKINNFYFEVKLTSNNTIQNNNGNTRLLKFENNLDYIIKKHTLGISNKMYNYNSNNNNSINLFDINYTFKTNKVFVKMTLYNLLNGSKFIIFQKDIFSTLSDMVYLNPRNISLGLTYNF